MKTIYLLLVLPFCLAAQHNFEAIDNNVIWEQIFEDTVSTKDLIVQINKNISQKNSAILEDKNTYGQSTYMDLIKDKKSLSAFFKQQARFGYSVEFKENKYRVTVRNIAFKGIAISLYGVTNDSDTYLDASLIRSRDGQLRKNKMSNKVLNQLNIAFTKIFTYKAEKDW